MKRKKYRKSEKIKCEICDMKFHTTGLSSHIIYTHKMEVDDYVKKYGEFRKNELVVKKKTRNIKKVKCEICNNSYFITGMFTHLRDTHDITVEDYTKKFSEYRPKYIDYKERAEKNKIECKVCGEHLGSERLLTYHIKKHHSLLKIDYIKKYILHNKIPNCTCGCGEEVKIVSCGKSGNENCRYIAQYKPGHNYHKPGYRINTREQREKMRKSAIERMKKKKGTWFQSGPSKEETKLFDFVRELAPDVIPNDKEILSGLELDIVIPSQKIAIEYNGGYWHSDLFKDKKYHLKKQREAEEAGYRLIHVWEADWFHKKEIIKSIISNILGKVENKIYARKTKIKEISTKEANEFLNNNHLQGFGVSKIRLGLFYGGELVSVMTFSSLRAATGQTPKKNQYELLRFCNKLNTSVVGGASKLFKYFLKTYNPDRVISYANKDWSRGQLYQKLGMSYLGDTLIGYFYTKSKFKYSRFQFQKHKLVEMGADPKLTEYEIMLNNGYLRTWDCGNLKYEFCR